MNALSSVGFYKNLEQPAKRYPKRIRFHKSKISLSVVDSAKPTHTHANNEQDRETHYFYMIPVYHTSFYYGMRVQDRSPAAVAYSKYLV